MSPTETSSSTASPHWNRYLADDSEIETSFSGLTPHGTAPIPCRKRFGTTPTAGVYWHIPALNAWLPRSQIVPVGLRYFPSPQQFLATTAHRPAEKTTSPQNGPSWKSLAHAAPLSPL